MDEISLRDYVERLFADHRQQHEDQRKASERSLDEWRKTLDHRLELLNELRADVVRDRSQYLTKVEFGAHVTAFERERDQTHEDLEEIRSTVDNWKGRQAAFAVILSVVVVVGTAIMSSVVYLIGR